MINEKALNKLEYEAVLERVSAFAVSKIAKEKVLKERPALSYEEALAKTEETFEAAALLSYGQSFDFSVDDVTETARQARVGSCLGMKQLLAVRRLLSVARLLQKQLSAVYEAADTSVLRARSFGFFTDEKLEDDIGNSILSEEEMSDKASAELFAVRKRLRALNAEVKQKLDAYTKKGEQSKYLQDAIVTIRSDRFVIPVKSEYKSFVPGIVHDRSGSGSTLFIEPMAVVELNNKLREETMNERAEILRILQAFTDRIQPHSAELIATEEAITDIDVIFAKAKYAFDTRSVRPVLNAKGVIDLKRARHPLLDKDKVVPVSVKVGKDFDIVVVTGPNTGGKTVTLKTVGLLALMASSGMFVPAGEDSVISYFDTVFCDIGDEQSIAQSLSTFSGHITNLRDILNEADERSLVLIDEVGAGTEPNEGAALALAVTEFLRTKKAKCVITTHYGQLKEYSLVASRVENASMEFDPETFAPTYKLVMGVPGSSNAIAIAEKLGMRKEVIDYARGNVSDEKTAFENVLRNAENIRRDYEAKKAEAEKEKLELEAERRRAEKLNDSLTAEREKLLSGSKLEAKRIIQRAEEESRELIEEIKNILEGDEIQEKSLFEARAAAKRLKSLEYRDNSENEDYYVFKGGEVPFDKLEKGAEVYSKKLNVAVIVEEIKSLQNITVRCGALKASVPADDLCYCRTEKPKKAAPKRGSSEIDTERCPSELNVIGKTVDEAWAEVDQYLDKAARKGLAEVSVIHGMGTGRLRAGIRERLHSHPHCESFRGGNYGEGGSGVTVVMLK